MKNRISILLLTVTFCLSENIAAQSKSPNDCSNYIQVCSSQNINMNVSGYGNVEEISGKGCSSNEHNSLWLQVTIEQSGTFGFELTPASANLNEDYDFWVFGPNATCGELGTSIRCSTTNPLAATLTYNTTGMRAGELDFSEGPGEKGNSYVRWLTVNAGETYFIVIDRPIGNSAFSLQWTGTATIKNPFSTVNFGEFADINLCDVNSDGYENFDFSTLSSAYLGSHTEYSLAYYRTESDAFSGINPIVGSTNLQAGTYFARINNSEIECFELRKINFILNTERSFIDTVICEGESILIGKNSYTTTGVYSDTLISYKGCDSIVSLNLTVNANTSFTDIQTACDSFTWIDGKTYTESTNTPTLTLSNSKGCDSLVTLHLTINKKTSSIDEQTACDNFTWIDGKTYTESTNAPTFMLSNSKGCDSLVTLHLTINKKTSSIDEQTVCDNFTWIDGKTYTESTNTPTFTLSNSKGCDSLVTLHLTINKTYGIDEQKACYSCTWIDGKTYTESTDTPTFTLTNSKGCDSLVTLHLTINDSVNTEIEAGIHYGEIYDKNNFNETAEGLYKQRLTTYKGCDSIVTLKLIVYPTITMPNAIDPSSTAINYTTLRQRNQFAPIVSGSQELYEYTLQIFNRWNTLIFETKKLMNEPIDASKHFWNGTNNGKILPEDAYLYYVKVRFKLFDDVFEKRGTVNIIYQ